MANKTRRWTPQCWRRSAKDSNRFVYTKCYTWSVAISGFEWDGDNIGHIARHEFSPEEVEEVINRHPEVRMSLVKTKKNPITGALVVADVVLRSVSGSEGDGDRQIQQDILLLCREELASHKVPATINFVSSLAVADSGKLIRRA